MKTFLLAWVFIFITNLSNAQKIRRFSTDSIRYITEIEFFLKKNIDDKNKSEEGEAFMEKFKMVWNGGKFKERERQEVYNISNIMLKKKLRAHPYFIQYLDAVLSFIAAERNTGEYIQWHRSIDYMLRNEHISKFKNYLETSSLLLQKNIIYQSRSTTWQADNDGFEFKFIEKPIIVFPEITLSCYAKGDSIKILNTSGMYDPLEKTWQGKSAKVTWERAGFDPANVYAIIDAYRIEMRYSKYSVDTVVFYNKNYFEKALKGSFEDKVMANTTEEKASYPRFVSFDKRLVIKSLFKDIDYLGGFAFHGNKLFGRGSEEEKAILTFYKDNKEFVVTRASTYIIRDDRINSDVVEMSLYYQNDSIFHPYIKLRYMDKSKQLTLYRSNEGMYKSPFFNSYHGIDMYFESLNWRLGSNSVDLSMTKSFRDISEAYFESSNYFSEARFDQYKGMDFTNPLYKIRQHAREINSDTVSVAGLAKHMTVPDVQIIRMLVGLSGSGLVDYDEKTRTAVLTDRFHFYLSAKGGKSDYDVVKFESKAENMSNGILNLDSFDLKINGVKQVQLSSIKNVYIYPYDEEITVKKNRDFAFAGHIKSGLFDFYGKDFYFDYENFKINLEDTDSMRFKVPTDEVDEYGRSELAQVRTALEDINGTLLIDAPGNKSGKFKFPQYPIFKCDPKTNSYVYYDRAFIQNGAYDRSKFFFQVKPFTIDSLDNASTENIAYPGTFVSGGIFPEMEDSLMVQPDMSLGFVRETGENGYPAYGGKGQFYNTINLSYEGLIGEGTLEYLTSTSESNEFILFLDSMNADVQKFTVEEQIAQVEYPPVTAENVYEHWLPYQDKMLVYKVNTPFDFYNGKAKFHGRMEYTPSLMSGDGLVAFYNSKLRSDLFKFKQHVFDADTADFELQAEGSEQLALTTTNYKTHIDFEEELGNFISNGGLARINFPINQYISYMDEFDWFMDKGDIELRNTRFTDIERYKKLSLSELIDEDLSGMGFVSIHPMQDSLQFFSHRAHYNINENIIEAEEARIIKVADAAIYPENAEVQVLKRAEMKTLRNAQLLADTATRYHAFYDATINITSRNEYYGRAKYDYIDENDEPQEIYFDNLNVDDSLYQTYAIGNISDISEFALSPFFDYQGKITLHAFKKHLNFDGGVKIKHDCQALERRWFYFNTDINPDTIRIPVPEQPLEYNKDRDKIYASIFIAKDTNNIFTSFLTPRHSFSDTAIVSADGYLVYHHPTDDYRISTIDKLNNRDSLLGNYLSLSTFDCEAYGEGSMNLGMDIGQVDMQTFGNIRHYTNTDSAEMKLMLTFDFFFDNKATRIMRDDFEAYTDLKGIDYTSFWYRKTLAQVVGLENAEEMISEMQLMGSYRRVPEKLRHLLVLNDIKFTWDDKNKSYISVGKIGVNNINNTPINKYVDGYIQLTRRKRGGQELNIYLEAANDKWYYFNYRNNFMQALSSNEEFNTTIKETKPKDRKMDVERGEDPYNYYLSTERKKDDFIKEMNE